MDKEQFVSLFSNSVLPLFTGAEIVGEEESTSRDFEVAQGSNGTMLVKPTKLDEYRLIIKRNQPFKNNDINLVKAILQELIMISSLSITEPAYLKKLQQSAIEKAICFSVTDVSGHALLELLCEITKWAERTYEGRDLTFGFVINENALAEPESLHFSKLLSNDFMALLSDGIKSTIELDKNGFLIGHSIFERQKAIPTICPQRYISFAKFCGNNKIGVTLTERGDMMIFKNHSLIFAKRRGIWNCFDHDALIDLLSTKANHTMKEIRKTIYITSLDVSFTGNGGCIAYLNKDAVGSALSTIDASDILEEKYYKIKLDAEESEREKLYSIFNKSIEPIENISYQDFIVSHKCIKAQSIHSIVSGRKFHELNRKLREELVSMDGATIVDFDGTIIAVGAIIKIDAGSSGGGRLAATKTLSKYGVSLKISTDGIIQCFSYDKRQNKPKPIFSIG